jgi:hypothetical protein
MSSDKRADRNRKNALASTGPKSIEGKQRSSKNALTYGLKSQSVVMAGESVEEWQAFQGGVAKDLNAQNSTELALCHAVASNLWRLQRGARYEAQCVSGRLSRDELIARYEDHLKSHPVELRLSGNVNEYKKVLQIKEAIEEYVNEAQWYESIAKLITKIDDDHEPIDLGIKIDEEHIKRVGIIAKVPKESVREIIREAGTPTLEDIYSVLKYSTIGMKKTIERLKSKAESSRQSAKASRKQFEKVSREYEAGLASFATRYLVPTKEDLERLQTYEAHIHRNLQRTLETFRQYRELQAMKSDDEIGKVASIVKKRVKE